MLRYDVEPWTATALVGTFLVLGVGSGDLLWAFQIGFVGSLAFGLLAIEEIELDRPWFSTVWSVCALMCSGIGVPMVAGCGLVALTRRNLKATLIAVIVPAVVFLTWWETIGHTGTATTLAFRDLPSYVWAGLTASVAGYFDLPHVVGAVLVVVLILAALWRRNVPAALAVTTVALYLFVGTGRSILGANQAAISRYSYLAVALLLPLAGQLMTGLARLRVLRPMVLTGLVVLIGVNGNMLQGHANIEAKLVSTPHRLIDAAAYLVSRGARFSGVALPTRSQTFGVASTLTLAQLADWVRRGQYPVPAYVSPTALRIERAVLSVYTSPTRANAGAVTFAEAHAPTCLSLPARTPVLVNLATPGSLHVDASNPMDFSSYDPIFVDVELYPVQGKRGHLNTLAFMSPTDHWLNLPSGRYGSAQVLFLNDGTLVCQGSG